ncbi:hypothetical protein C8Q72DRAFT_281103 [Fomitopsis betulina]|nr:hypothetical protein C8Q72DRAFT_281103 [Fomitopsis betulina]
MMVPNEAGDPIVHQAECHHDQFTTRKIKSSHVFRVPSALPILILEFKWCWTVSILRPRLRSSLLIVLFLQSPFHDFTNTPYSISCVSLASSLLSPPRQLLCPPSLCQFSLGKTGTPANSMTNSRRATTLLHHRQSSARFWVPTFTSSCLQRRYHTYLKNARIVQRVPGVKREQKPKDHPSREGMAKQSNIALVWRAASPRMFEW